MPNALQKQYVSEEEIILALQESKGNITRAARKLEYSSKLGLHKRIKKSPKLTEIVKKLKETFRESIHAEKIKKTLKKYKGKLGKTAARLEMTVTELKEEIKVNPYLKEIINDLKEYELDLVERVLLKKILKDEETNAIKFYLKCQGKKRGWMDKPELSVDQMPPITINITPADPNSNIPPQQIKIESKKISKNSEDIEDAQIVEEKPKRKLKIIKKVQ